MRSFMLCPVHQKYVEWSDQGTSHWWTMGHTGVIRTRYHTLMDHVAY
jgi:hypothetical protein